MKTFMKVLEFIMKNSGKVFKAIAKFFTKKQQELEADKRDDD